MERDTIQVLVIQGCEGPSLYFANDASGWRVAGPKPLSGGETICEFIVSVDEINTAIERHAYRKKEVQ